MTIPAQEPPPAPSANPPPSDAGPKSSDSPSGTTAMPNLPTQPPVSNPGQNSNTQQPPLKQDGTDNLQQSWNSSGTNDSPPSPPPIPTDVINQLTGQLPQPPSAVQNAPVINEAKAPAGRRPFPTELLPENIHPHSTVAQPPPANASIAYSVATAPDGPKHPFMKITLLLLVILGGFGGSFLFFRFTTPQTNRPIVPLITPPISNEPTQTVANVNPFITPTTAYQNPFASPSAAYQNPFGEYQNPFADGTRSAQLQSYTNPFENMK